MNASQHEVSTLQGTLETLPGDIFGHHSGGMEMLLVPTVGKTRMQPTIFSTEQPSQQRKL